MRKSHFLFFFSVASIIDLRAQVNEFVQDALFAYSTPCDFEVLKVDTIRFGNDSIHFLYFYDEKNEHRKTIGFNEKGLKSFEINLKNKKLDGPGFAWHENGKIESLSIYNQGTGVTFSFYDTGTIKGITESSNYERIGLYREWWDNGQLKFEENYDDSIHDFVAFNNMGKLWVTGCKIRGVIWVGKYKEWHANGQMKTEGNYKELPSNIDVKEIKTSIKEGDWTYYDENGKLILVETYKEGILLKSKKY